MKYMPTNKNRRKLVPRAFVFSKEKDAWDRETEENSQSSKVFFLLSSGIGKFDTYWLDPFLNADLKSLHIAPCQAIEGFLSKTGPQYMYKCMGFSSCTDCRLKLIVPARIWRKKAP